MSNGKIEFTREVLWIYWKFVNHWSISLKMFLLLTLPGGTGRYYFHYISEEIEPCRDRVTQSHIERGRLRQLIKSCLQSFRLGTWSILVLPIKCRSQKNRRHLSFHTLDNKYDNVYSLVLVEGKKLTVLAFLTQRKLWSFRYWRS